MTDQELKELFKKAYEAGRTYQRWYVNPWRWDESTIEPPSFTKWYSSEVNRNKFQMTTNERLDALTEDIDDPHIENLIRMGR